MKSLRALTKLLIAAIVCVLSAAGLKAQITLGTQPQAVQNQPRSEMPRTWDEAFNRGAPNAPAKTRPSRDDLRHCAFRVTSPDSLFISGGPWLDLSLWTHLETRGFNDWQSVVFSPSLTDTLSARVLDLDCAFAQSPFGIVLQSGPYFLRLNGKSFLQRDASIEQVQNARILVRGVNGSKEPAALFDRQCDTCAYAITSGKTLIDSANLRIRRAVYGLPRSSPEDSATAQYERERVEEIRARHWSQAITEAVIARQILISMTPDHVRASLGAPDAVNRTVTQNVVHEQWVYSKSGVYVYFDKGRVTAWQMFDR